MKTFLMCLAAGSLGGLLTALVPTGHAGPDNPERLVIKSRDGKSSVVISSGEKWAGMFIENGQGDKVTVLAEDGKTYFGIYDRTLFSEGCSFAITSGKDGVGFQFYDPRAPGKDPTRFLFKSVPELMDALAPKKKD